MMEVNYAIATGAIVIIVLLIIFLVYKNSNQKKFEREMNQSAIKPQKHDDV